jgi:sigma-B regulation protein RsbU (phosphoserine phosphatase)
MAQLHVQVILAADNVPESLRVALQRMAATASFWPLAEALRGDPAAGADALVIVVPEDVSGLLRPLRALFDRLAERPRATLVVAASGRTPPLDFPPTLPVIFGSNLDEHDLTVRLATMLEMRSSLDMLHRGMLANRRSGESVARRYMSQLRLASQVQREFLPEALPRFGPVSFHVVFHPIDYVSGDIYDVRRLDEEHVGVAVADASGHGIPAALLTVYIKRALRGKEIENGAYRILSPDEVLAALNDDILDAHLSECPFVAAVYAVLNINTLELSLARGGAPYPLYRTGDGRVQLVESPGGLVGVDPATHFEATTLQLQPGDSLLLYSDGLERIITPPPAGKQIPEPLRRAAEHVGGWTATAAEAAGGGEAGLDSGAIAVATLPSEGGNAITGSDWGTTLREHGPAVALEQLSCRQRALRRMGYPLDDLTVLAIQVDAS